VTDETIRLRREPPRFRRVAVRRVEALSPRMARVTLAGPELDGWTLDEPAASVRLLLPTPGSTELVMPAWNGNEFLLPDGQRATIRTLTPRRFDPAAAELDVDIVLHHDGGVAAAWAQRATPGDEAAISGPARGYAVDRDAAGLLLAGDETAIPAIGQLLEWLPAGRAVRVLIEVSVPDARIPLPARPGTTVEWLDQAVDAPPGDALIAALEAADIATGEHVWAAGEAAAMQRIRRHLFADRGMSRADATVRGYWKHGRVGNDAAT
jgi:NADPH-dependent ferric siderophore reductase